jgi:hypothetical protein
MPSTARLGSVGDAMSDLSERRASARRPIVVAVCAWSLVQPTRRRMGSTVDLSPGGALLRLPGLSDAAERLEVRLALPDRPLTATARIVRRQPPDHVAVAFESLSPADYERLLEFARTAR